MEKKELFSVMWRFSDRSGTMRGDYTAPNLKALMRVLNAAENVSPSTCSEIVVHHHQGPGTVEVFVHDSTSNVTHINFPTKQQIKALDELQMPVHKLNKKERRVQRRKEEAEARKKVTASRQKTILVGAALLLDSLHKTTNGKPHIRLPTAPVKPHVLGAYGLYRAYEA